MKRNLSTNACDPERLESFLCGDLSDADEGAFTLHLNTCESCRRTLAEQAAEPEIWREAELLLKPSPFDAPSDGGARDSGLAPQITRQTPQIQTVLDALGPTDDPEMVGRLGGYEVSGVVGAGGMGVVLKAVDKSLDRTVAIKVMTPFLATSGAARKRFAREAKAAAAVLHPNVIAIHGVSNDESLPYLVMPYVRGTSLQRRLDREGPLPLREILRIGAQIAAGLAAAHAQGLVHRDIKPANILLDDGVERVTITDFGLARAIDDATITHSGMIAGTPQYMSPEQARGEAVDPRSDLFSLGSVLYAACTGRPPFRAETSYGVLRRITDDEPTAMREINSEIPDWLCRIVGKLMSKRAGDRYQSAAEVAELLEACLAHVQQPTAALLPASLQPKSSVNNRFYSLSRRWLGVPAMTAVLGLGLLGIFAWQTTEPPDIGGAWAGSEWGEIVLKPAGDAEYAGVYSDTIGAQAGEIQLKWSRIERRFNGAWREGEDRFGELSIRLVGDEIRGAFTTDAKSRINPATPRLADLLWTRTTAAGVSSPNYLRGDVQYLVPGPEDKLRNATFSSVFERELRHREAIDFETPREAMIPGAEINPQKALLWVLEQRLPSLTAWMEEQGMDAICGEGSSLTAFGMKVNELSNADWTNMEPSRLVDALKLDWKTTDPRQFSIAIRSIEPNAPPHAVMALRTSQGLRPRTIAFQTREGGIGILQLVESTNVGFKIRFKLLRPDPANDSAAPAIEDSGAFLSLPGMPAGYRHPISAAQSEEAPSNTQSLADAAKRFNAETAEVRKKLFTPPIPDLTVERLREGFRQTAELYRRQRKQQVADALQKIADTGRLPLEGASDLIATGVHAQDDDGQTVSRQLVPGLVLPDNTTATGNLLVVLRPLELMYRKDGPVSTDYGSHFAGEESQTGDKTPVTPEAGAPPSPNGPVPSNNLATPE
jgi:serine/threonine protein kinase